MTVLVLAGVAVWFVVAWPVALVLGRVLAARDRQHPRPDRASAPTLQETR